MRNTHKEFHPGTPIETVLGFSKKVLLPITVISIFLLWSFYPHKSYGQKSLKLKEDDFCFKITEIRNGTLIEKSSKLSCFKQNEPPSETKKICKENDWYSISIGRYVCVNKNNNGYSLERKYPT